MSQKTENQNFKIQLELVPDAKSASKTEFFVSLLASNGQITTLWYEIVLILP